MTEKWTWGGEPENIHIVQEDAPHMRVCFLTSDGPTEKRANLISAAPDMALALKPFVEWLADIEKAAVSALTKSVTEMPDDATVMSGGTAILIGGWDACIDLGDLRRARAALAKATGVSHDGSS